MKNKDLEIFLLEAKKKTFASKLSFPIIKRDGSKEYVYRKGFFVYRDNYFGSNVDTGRELVFFKGMLLWSMAYMGGMILGEESISRACFSFLKECLRNAPLDFPVRGPKYYKNKNFVYTNSWEGTLEDFVGEEKIFFGEKQVYFRNYLGGTGKLKER